MEQRDLEAKSLTLVAPRPLSHHVVVDTRDPDAARDMIGRIFCPHRLIPLGRDAASVFDARHHTAAFGALTVNYVAYGAPVTIDPGRLESFYLLQIPLAGCAEVTNGAATVSADSGHATLLSPTLETRMIWGEGCEKLIVQVPRAMLDEQIVRYLEHIPRSVSFAHGIDLSSPRGSAILAQARLALHLVERRCGAGQAGALEHELGASLCTLLAGHIIEHGHGEIGMPRSRRAAAAPAHVRRVEDYIRAHLDSALSLHRLAVQAGCSMRSLQESFRHFRETTVSDFILAQRLDRWRALIATSRGEVRVGDLALSVGLNHLGRAAAAYRDRFGEAPSQTLRGRKR